MKKAMFFALLMSLSSMTAFADVRRPPTYQMPEPSGLAELATCAIGLGAFALRRLKR